MRNKPRSHPRNLEKEIASLHKYEVHKTGKIASDVSDCLTWRHYGR